MHSTQQMQQQPQQQQQQLQQHQSQQQASQPQQQQQQPQQQQVNPAQQVSGTAPFGSGYPLAPFPGAGRGQSGVPSQTQPQQLQQFAGTQSASPKQREAKMRQGIELGLARPLVEAVPQRSGFRKPMGSRPASISGTIDGRRPSLSGRPDVSNP
eukprot:m.168852 g.168852  ORF g.168852 m.168852 type:complete len:154 (+) comp17796_c2_seq1:1204-1665(+)